MGNTSIMKFVLALLFLAGLALAQEAEKGPNAEADPAAWYGGYYGYPYRGYYGYGGYYGHGYGYGYYGRKKREADPAVLATTHAAPAVVPHLGYGYALGAPYLHHAVPHTYTIAHKDAVVTPAKVDVKVAAAPVVYAGHYGYAHPYAHWGYGLGLPLLAKPAEEAAAVDARKKREAEADPEAWYYGHYGYGLGYGHHLGYGYGGYYGYPGYYYGK